MKRICFLIGVLITTFLGSYAQVQTSTSGRVDRITTDFTTRILDGQYNRELLGSGWISGIGDYLFLKHGGNNTEAGTFGLRISDGRGFEFGKNDFGSSFLKINTLGNVGVGITNPQEKLEVNGKIYLNSGGYDFIYWARHNMTMGTKPGRYFHNNLMLKPGGASEGFLHSTLSLFDAPSENNHVEKVRIRSYGDSFFNGGKIGIGTENPQEKLEVNGNIYLNSGGYDFIYWARHNMTMGTKPGRYFHNNLMLKPGGASEGFLHSTLSLFDAPSENNHIEKIRIRSSGDSFFNGGNVGIGATNPISKLQVNGDFFLNSSTSTNGWGTTNFYWKGHSLIMGSATGRYAHNKIELKPGGSSSGELISTFSLYQALQENTHEERVSISSSKNHATWFNGGNVGIGTTTPDAKLAVNGNIHTREVKVDLQGWPDYVFEDTYNLPTLNEVEQHITEKGHLINIPSAAEVEETGIYLGEMNAKLLEKIEELTLYTIAQEKEIEELKKQTAKIKILEEQIQELITTKR